MPGTATGPLAGLRVVELAHEYGAFAAKLLADAGADVVVVEPPGGAAQRTYAPFAGGEAHAEKSLVWWAENTSKRSIVLDLRESADAATVLELIGAADVLVECHPADDLADLGLDDGALDRANPRLLHVTITPFGRHDPDSHRPATDLTVLAGGGPAWSCGYDDHGLPPVRGGGDQGYRIACHFAVMSVMTALFARDRHGHGVRIDVNMHAAANVTTEFASYSWLVAGETVQRQTGRHATARPSEPTQVECGDGRWLNTGTAARSPAEFSALLGLLKQYELVDDFPMAALLEMGGEYEHITLAMLQEEPLVAEIFGAGRDAIAFLAANLPAHEAFTALQDVGIAAGVIYSPDEMMSDPHFVARGFPTEVHHEQIDRTVLYPGAPMRFTASPMGIRHRAPLLDEHREEILAELAGG